MPRQIHKITRFEGGVNSATDPRDIQEGESLELTSFVVDSVGRVRMSGASILDETLPIIATGDGDTIKAGAGFFIFSYDYNMLLATDDLLANGNVVRENTEYFLYQDDEHTVILQLSGIVNFALDSTGHLNPNGVGTAASFNSGLRDGASAGIDVVAQYYFADRALRISDKSFNNDYKTRWIGHIKRDLFHESSGTTQNLNLWHSTTTRLLPPEDTAYSETIGSEKPGKVDHTHNAVTAIDDATLNIQTTSQAGNIAGTWIAGDYPFYVSYIYDGSQESPVHTLSTDSTIVVDEALYMHIVIDYYSSGAYQFNPRITGARVYYSDPVDGHGIKYHLLDIDFVNGCRKFSETEWTDWVEIGSGNEDYACPGTAGIGSTMSNTNSFVFEDMPKTVTYEMLNSYAADEVTHAEYKCSTIFNNRCNIGNIRQPRTVGGAYGSNTPTHNDRIIRSPINFEGKPQYDTFPATHKMDVAANDGDDITALRGFGDRLLIFKKKSVYIVNVAQDGAEFVEDKIYGVGVLNDTQVTETEYGIVWIRNSGCYLFSGQGKPIDITEGKLSVSPNKHAPRMKWHIDEVKIPSIIYLPNEKKLLISLGLVANYSSDVWIYDFVSKSWTFSGAFGDATKTKSNMALSSSGQVYFSQYRSSDRETYFWDDTPQDSPSTAGEMRMVTKDIDFGQPSVKKNIYKVYVNFRTRTGLDQATNIICTYQTNGNTSYSGTWHSDSTGVIDAGSTVYKELSETSDTGTNKTGLAGTTNITFDGTNTSTGGTGVFTEHIQSGVTGDADDIGDFAAKINGNKLTLESLTSSENDGIIYDEITLVGGTYYELSVNHFALPGFIGATTGRVMLSYNSGGDPLTTLANFRLPANIIVDLVCNGWGSSKATFLVPGSGNVTTYLGFDLNGDTGPFTNTVGDGMFAFTMTQRRVFTFYNVAIHQTSNWNTAELIPLSPIRNAYSFGLQFQNDNTVTKEFEIGDISIVYRNKGIR